MSRIIDIESICRLRYDMGLTCKDCMYQGEDCLKMQKYYKLMPEDPEAIILKMIDDIDYEKPYLYRLTDSFRIWNLRYKKSTGNSAVDNK